MGFTGADSTPQATLHSHSHHHHRGCSDDLHPPTLHSLIEQHLRCASSYSFLQLLTTSFLTSLLSSHLLLFAMTSPPPVFPFDAIVVTSASPMQAQAYTLELELRRRIGLIPDSTLIVAVPDPAGYRVGSGGATLNALAVVSQRLCYQAGYSDLNPRFLRSKRILIMHSGGDSQRIPIFSVRGKAFSSLPSTDEAGQHVNAPIDFLIQRLISIFASAPEGGAVITATDVLLLMPETYKWNPEHAEGITGIGIFAPQQFGPGHGCYIVDPAFLNADSLDHVPVTNIIQKPSIPQLKQAGGVRADGSIVVDSGIIYFSAEVTSTFLSLQNISPLDSCTDTGLDHGNIPFRFELYTDIILVTNPSLTRDDFLNMPLPSKDSDPNRVERGRRLLWKLLRPYKFYIIADRNSHFSHVGTTSEYLHILNNDNVFRSPFRLSKRSRAFVEYPDLVQGGVLINSILAGHGRVEEGALVENSYLRGNFHVAANSVVSGVRSISGIQTMPHMVVQEVQLNGARVRSHPRVRHLLGVKGEIRAREQPFSVAPPLGDASRYVEPRTSGADEVLRVIVVFGVFDGIKDPYKTKKSTLCNRHWSHYFPPSVFSSTGRTSDPVTPLPGSNPSTASLHSFAHLQLDPDDDGVWPASIPDNSRTLWNARIYPVLVGADAPAESVLWIQYDSPPSVQSLSEWKQSTRVSLEDILSLSDAPQEFYWRARASFLVDLKEMESILLERKDRPLLPIIQRCQPEYKADLLASLDSIASTGPLDVCARTLCTIADVLASLPGTHMFTRTGPARNPQWAHAIELISQAKTCTEQAKGVSELASMREQWLKVGSSQLYMRAARHYDGAWASLTRKGVETVKANSVAFEERKEPVMVGQTVEATSPVRIDLCGGWSDTPPITYEHGGKVTNVAVSIDGQHPIGASAKSFFLPPSSDKVIIVKTGRSRTLTLDETQAIREDDPDDTVFLSKPSDLSDYNDPTAPAALVKCVILALGIVDLSSSLSLPQQIQRAIPTSSFTMSQTPSAGVGLYIRSWSTLPQGTGLGVSSILAADIVTAVAAVVGKQFSLHNLMHVVLMVEQMLTTGGGWQDQVGGCYPGFKIGVSGDRLPLLVEVHPIAVPPAFLQEFSSHCLLIHTGQSRLAKNLLGTVLRRWYQRDEVVTRTVDSLCTEAEAMRVAIEKGDLAEVGRLLQVYWELKKVMASPMPTTLKQAKEAPVEPEHIARLSARLRGFVHGLSLLGAGGGGFMCLVTKGRVDEGVKGEVQAVLDALNAERKAAVQRETDRETADTSNAGGEDEFADDWPTGDYQLFGAQVCEKGITLSVK